MKIIDKSDNSVIAEIITNRSMTIEEALDIAGIEWVETENETGYEVDGIFYGPEDFEMVY